MGNCLFCNKIEPLQPQQPPATNQGVELELFTAQDFHSPITPTPSIITQLQQNSDSQPLESSPASQSPLQSPYSRTIKIPIRDIETYDRIARNPKLIELLGKPKLSISDDELWTQ